MELDPLCLLVLVLRLFPPPETQAVGDSDMKITPFSGPEQLHSDLTRETTRQRVNA